VRMAPRRRCVVASINVSNEQPLHLLSIKKYIMTSHPQLNCDYNSEADVRLKCCVLRAALQRSLSVCAGRRCCAMQTNQPLALSFSHVQVMVYSKGKVSGCQDRERLSARRLRHCLCTGMLLDTLLQRPLCWRGVRGTHGDY
jgi:hypothetical protein